MKINKNNSHSNLSINASHSISKNKNNFNRTLIAYSELQSNRHDRNPNHNKFHNQKKIPLKLSTSFTSPSANNNNAKINKEEENKNKMDNCQNDEKMTKKLYTFCGLPSSSRKARDKENKDVNVCYGEESGFSMREKNLFNNEKVSYEEIDQSSIIIKQNEIKLFTKKFACQKLQYEEKINILEDKICKLQEKVDTLMNKNSELSLQRSDLFECLKYEQEENKQLKWKVKSLSNQISQTQTKFNHQYSKLQAQLSKQLQQCEQLKNIIQEKQVQIQKYANTNFLHSQHSSSNFTCTKESYINQIQSTIACQSKQWILLQIENEHLQKALCLQKESNTHLHQQVQELKISISQLTSQNNSLKQCVDETKNRNVGLKQQIVLNKVEGQHGQQKSRNQVRMLENSLKISLQLINSLTVQKDTLQKQLKDVQEKVAKKVVMYMMKEQLQREENAIDNI